MFLSSKYVLANELIKRMGIGIANISILCKKFQDANNTTIIKLNSLTFINKDSQTLPKNIYNALNEHTFTDISNKLPCNYVRSEYGITKKDLSNIDAFSDIVDIGGNNFFVFRDEFVKKLRGKIIYILDKEEAIDCYRKGLIEGYDKISNNRYLTWYK